MDGNRKKLPRWNKNVKEYSVRPIDEATGAIAV
jgi:hypothetical protein